MLETYITYQSREVNSHSIVYTNAVLKKPIGNHNIGTQFDSIVVYTASNEVYLEKGFGYRIDKFKFNTTFTKLN